MSQLPTPRLEDFARLIALGWPPTLAAKGAGYGIRRASRAAARLAQPGVSARVTELTAPQAATNPETEDAKDDKEAVGHAEIGRPNLRPELTEEEWMAKYAPHLLEDWRAKNKG